MSARGRAHEGERIGREALRALSQGPRGAADGRRASPLESPFETRSRALARALRRIPLGAAMTTQTILVHMPGFPPMFGDALRAAAPDLAVVDRLDERSEEHTSELQSQSLISYAVFCLDRKSVV